MKKILIAFAALAMGITAASAADLPARPYTKAPPAPLPPPCIWCGFYIGLNGGWVGNQGSNDLRASTFENGVLLTGPLFSHNSQNTNGGFGGGQIGYNWVFPGGLGAAGYGGASGWLVGVEADIQGASLHGNAATVSFFDADGNLASATADSRLNWFGTVRGRVGWATGPVLFYGTGGFAYGSVRNNLLVNFQELEGDCDPGFCAASTLVSNDSTRTGWVAGVGIEWMFAPNWSLKGEYQYISLGSINQAAAAFITEVGAGEVEGATSLRHVNENFNTVRIGVNYHFSGFGGAPLVAHY